jgi:transposase-like protein
MQIPDHCPRFTCTYSSSPPPGWFCRYGHYRCAAHGRIQRYRCRGCRHTFSDQTRSLHFFAKRRLPLRALWYSLLAGASCREIARRYHTSSSTIQNALLRLGRQAMAAQLQLLAALNPPARVVYDGLRSCLTSQDYPCELTTAVEPAGETILTISHTVRGRGGAMNAAQRRRVAAKRRVWQPEHGAMSGDIRRLHREIWEYLRSPLDAPAVIDTDEHPLYRALLRNDPVAVHLRLARQLEHHRTCSRAPRTITNPLFAVNYIDRLLRHRLREHTRETIAIGRNATLQMHRAWIFAVDHNCLREYRVKRVQLGRHAEQGAVSSSVVRRVEEELFRRRIEVRGLPVPETIRLVWQGKLAGPPVRWRVGQKGSSVKIPRYALRDLGAVDPHAA